MKTLTLKLTLYSPALIGSGEGFGAVIDSDIVYDEIGIPYIPAKRIKGCLKDSAIEICEIFHNAKINLFDLSMTDSENRFKIVDSLFGTKGSEKPAPIYFSNLVIEDYQNIFEWLKYLMKAYKNIINRQAIINYFSEIRQQTSIDEETGTTKEHSLRTIRVAKKDLVFNGTIDLEEERDEYIRLLYFACLNFRLLGTKRNRGFGKVKCQLYENSKEINFLNKLEELCKQ
jgi:CRISPR-associated protein Csx10